MLDIDIEVKVEDVKRQTDLINLYSLTFADLKEFLRGPPSTIPYFWYFIAA